MKESVAVAKEADAKKDFSPTRSDNSIPRLRDEPERQLGSLKDVIGNIRRDGGTPSVDSIATHLSGMHTAQRAPVLLALQQTHGNRYVQRVVTGIQAKLKIGQPGDMYEQEADRIADEVMRMPEPGVQWQAEEEEEKSIQTKPLDDQIAPLVQRQVEPEEEEEEEEEEEPLMTKSISSETQVKDDIYTRLNLNKGGGQPLSEADRSFMEKRFGIDFSGVRAHTDSNAVQMSRELNAQAFTHGRDIYFGTGRYNPGTSLGRRLLAHELTHVVQQLPHLHLARTPGDECLTGHREGEGQVSGDEYWMWGTWRGRETRIAWARRVINNWITWRFGRNLSPQTRTRISRILLSGHLVEPSIPTTSGCQYIFFTPRSSVSTIVRLVRREQSQVSESGSTEGRPSETTSEAQPEAETAPEGTEREGSAAPISGLETGESTERGRGGLAGVESAVEETERLSEEPVATVSGDLSVLENAQLANHYLDVLEHYACRSISSEDREAAADGLSREEISEINNDNALRRTITAHYTQGYREFQADGGSEPNHFFRLEETIIEQFVRGNPTATHNQLRIGHGEPERDVLGIVHRQNGILYYDANGFPLPAFGGPGMRDRGYIGSEQPEELGINIANIQDPGLRMLLNTLRQTFSDPTRMTLEAAQIYFDNIERVNDRVRNGPPPIEEDILRRFEESLPFFVGFLAGHGLSTFLMRVPNPAVAAVGLALKGLLTAAGYIMSIDFAGQALSHLLDAAYHLSRVEQNEQGELTGLSERHLRAAAEPIRQMVIEVALSLGTLLLTRAARGTIRCSRCRFLRIRRRAARRAHEGQQLGFSRAQIRQIRRAIIRRRRVSSSEVGRGPRHAGGAVTHDINNPNIIARTINNPQQILVSQQNGKWVFYRNGTIVITQPNNPGALSTAFGTGTNITTHRVGLLRRIHGESPEIGVGHPEPPVSLDRWMASQPSSRQAFRIWP